MNRLLDFVFIRSIFVGYSFLLEGTGGAIVYLLIPAFGCFMANSLSQVAYGE
jgi:hypothetical protein